jgi:hypothetical protein
MGMDIQKHAEATWAFVKSLEGTVVFSDGMVDNLNFISESKRLAKTHDWLYHCTTAGALKSILKNREFWLSNLKIVNDDEEAGRIDVPEYENKYYICCFTYDSQIPDAHWIEYGSESDGVLIGVKREWFLRQATFLSGDAFKNDDDFIIMKNYEEALAVKRVEQQKNRKTNPFYINAFDFFQVVYDDTLLKKIVGTSSMRTDENKIYGRFFTPEVAGIIKSTHGISRRHGREPHEKDWTSEKEVRLKVGIQQLDIFYNGNEQHDGMIMGSAFFSKIKVPVSDKAFDIVKIGFSPKFVDRDAYLKDLRKLLPDSVIEMI